MKMGAPQLAARCMLLRSRATSAGLCDPSISTTSQLGSSRRATACPSAGSVTRESPAVKENRSGWTERRNSAFWNVCVP